MLRGVKEVHPVRTCQPFVMTRVLPPTTATGFMPSPSTSFLPFPEHRVSLTRMAGRPTLPLLVGGSMDQELVQYLDERFAGIGRRFEQIDQGFQQVDRRFEQVDRQFAVMRREMHAGFDEVKRHNGV